MAKKPSAGGIILAAVALGLIAAYMIYRLESNREKQAKEHWIPIVVAREDIPARTKVTNCWLKMRNCSSFSFRLPTLMRPERILLSPPPLGRTE